MIRNNHRLPTPPTPTIAHIILLIALTVFIFFPLGLLTLRRDYQITSLRGAAIDATTFTNVDTTTNTPILPTPPTPHDGNPEVLLLAHSQDLSNVSPAVWSSISSYCSSLPTPITLSILHNSPSTPPPITLECQSVNIITDSSLLLSYSFTDSTSSRQSFLNQKHRELYNTATTTSPSFTSIITLSLDVLTLPKHVSTLLTAITTVTSTSSPEPYDVLCSLPLTRWWSLLPTYADPLNSVDLTGSSWSSEVSSFLGVGAGGDAINDMRACYGGLAVYRGGDHGYFDPECSYEVGRGEGSGHSHLQMCLGDGSARVGILTDMVVEFPVTSPLLKGWFAAFFAIIVTLICGVLCGRRSKAAKHNQ